MGVPAKMAVEFISCARCGMSLLPATPVQFISLTTYGYVLAQMVDESRPNVALQEELLRRLNIAPRIEPPQQAFQAKLSLCTGCRGTLLRLIGDFLVSASPALTSAPAQALAAPAPSSVAEVFVEKARALAAEAHVLKAQVVATDELPEDAVSSPASDPTTRQPRIGDIVVYLMPGIGGGHSKGAPLIVTAAYQREIDPVPVVCGSVITSHAYTYKEDVRYDWDAGKTGAFGYWCWPDEFYGAAR